MGRIQIRTIVDLDLFLNNGFGSNSGSDFDSELALLIADPIMIGKFGTGST